MAQIRIRFKAMGLGTKETKPRDIQFKARLTKYEEISDFNQLNSRVLPQKGVSKFIKRNGLSMRTRTTVAQ